MANEQEYVTFNEIYKQTEAWRDAFEVVNAITREIAGFDLAVYQQVLFVGCGSTYYLSMAAANLFQSQNNVVCKASPASESILFPNSVFTDKNTLLIAISRSGTTTETIQAVREFNEKKRGDVIVLTNYGNSPLAKLGDLSISINAGQEKSVVQTRSFASMYIASTFMSHIFSGSQDFYSYKEKLVGTGDNLIKTYHDFAKSLANDHDFRNVFFLGSGLRYGLANEVSLKLKEMSQTSTQPFHFLEFRHGPISMVDEKTLIIGLMSEKANTFEMEVMNEARKFHAKTIAIGDSGCDVNFESGLPEEARGVLYLPVLHLFAYYRAISFDKNPDSPRNITSVVELEI